jgi:hypothetical protein
MAYRELGVIELREVWRRYSAGDGVRATARGAGTPGGRPAALSERLAPY